MALQWGLAHVAAKKHSVFCLFLGGMRDGPYQPHLGCDELHARLPNR
jgi:hypothetical protein